MIDGWDTCSEIGLRRMSLDLSDDKSTLVQVMAWCRQATSHYLSQCWPSFLSPYGVTRPWRVNILRPARRSMYMRQWIESSLYPLHWRHNGRDSVSNHQPHDCLLNRLFRRRSKKTSHLRVTGLCVGNSPVPGEFPAQMASNAGKCFHLMTSSWDTGLPPVGRQIII